MATIKYFEELESWKKARIIYKSLSSLIDKGRFGKSYSLINQVESAVGSIMDNIAEGFERGTKSEFIQFLGYAKGSCGELRSQLYRALDRKYISQAEFDDLKLSLMNTSGLIQNLINYLLKTKIGGVRKKIV